MGLRVNIEGLRFRASDGKLNTPDQLRLIGRRLSNIAVTRLRAGDNPADLERILSQRQPLALKISGVKGASAAAWVIPSAVLQQIRIPEMIDISEKLSIMKGEVTVGLFKQVMQGYLIEGHNVNKLKAIILDGYSRAVSLIWVSLIDAREFAKRLSEQTGRKFRVPTEAEWKQAKDRLSGANWTWTETESIKGSGSFVLHRLDDYLRAPCHPGRRNDFSAIRLVEDK